MKNNKKGFTLVELVVTLALMAILATIVTTSSIHIVNKNKEKQKLTMMESFSIRIVEQVNKRVNLDFDNVGSLQSVVDDAKNSDKELASKYTILFIENKYAGANFNDTEKFPPNVNGTDDWASHKKGECIMVSFYPEGNLGERKWYCRLQFYEDGVYKNIVTTKWLRDE